MYTMQMSLNRNRTAHIFKLHISDITQGNDITEVCVHLTHTPRRRTVELFDYKISSCKSSPNAVL